MMFAGLRTCEALALTWENLNFENKSINAERGITTIPKFDKDENVIKRITVVIDTKTACPIRTVPIPDILVKALEEYKVEQELNGDLHKTNLIDKNFLCLQMTMEVLKVMVEQRKFFIHF